MIATPLRRRPITATPTVRRSGAVSFTSLRSGTPGSGSRNEVRTHASGRKVGVDLKTEVIHGYVVAEEGWFKDRRGQFNRAGLSALLSVFKRDGREKGLRSRFTHPSLSDDGLGKYLGRARDPWLDDTGERWKVRADLHISPSSRDTPSGDLGGYILRLCHEDPSALSTSVVLEADQEEVLNPDGTRKKSKNEHGEVEYEPPVWTCTRLIASDVVDTGDAVNDMLSVDDLPGATQRTGWAMLDRMFRGAEPEVIRARVGAYLDRYLSHRSVPVSPTPTITTTKPTGRIRPTPPAEFATLQSEYVRLCDLYRQVDAVLTTLGTRRPRSAYLVAVRNESYASLNTIVVKMRNVLTRANCPRYDLIPRLPAVPV